MKARVTNTWNLRNECWEINLTSYPLYLHDTLEVGWNISISKARSLQWIMKMCIISLWLRSIWQPWTLNSKSSQKIDNSCLGLQGLLVCRGVTAWVGGGFLEGKSTAGWLLHFTCPPTNSLQQSTTSLNRIDAIFGQVRAGFLDTHF